ncbi:MAG: preprotein translocase subunit SecE [Lachnospiraceae bacterium]|nr:preprotein translocase subunit SecE [Lachnospiraceae bacterium]
MADKNEKKVRFFDGVKAEFAKITWPTPKEIAKQTFAVTVISVVLGALIAVLDLAFQYGVDFLIKL